MTGPPGCGKTTALARYARDAALARGPESVVLASLTKAAASEIASRDVPVQRDHVGTLHALCYRALGKPELADKHLAEWNEEHPDLVLGGAAVSTLDDPTDQPDGETRADKLRAQMELLRHQLVPDSIWPTHVLAFAQAWRAWLRDHDLIDFTGLLELAAEIVPTAPGEPSVLIGDEVQDWSRLETRLFRDTWGRHAETVILTGDPDQSIFEWRGADPRIFLDHLVAPENERILAQSYRVPRAVHALAQRVIRQIDDRADVAYHPRRDEDGDPVEGAVERSSATWRRPERLLDLFETAAAGGPSVMVLATCGYLLAPTLAVLRKHALPFANPYRRARGDWNPLRAGDARATHAADRVLAFLRAEPSVWGDGAREWTAADLRAWIDPLEAKGLLARGAKALLDRRDFVVSRDFFDLFVGGLESEAAQKALDADLAWYRSKLLASRAKAMALALDVAERRGGALLREAPRICVGSIHSVKGGEADTVVIFPDLSVEAARAGMTPSGRDALARLLYVAVTRARERVVVCAPATTLRMRIPL